MRTGSGTVALDQLTVLRRSDRLPDGQCLRRFGDIVGADQLNAAGETGERGGGRPGGAAGGTLAGAGAADEAFARDTREERAAEAVIEREIGQDREVVGIALAETDAGIERDARGTDASGGAGGEPGGEEGVGIEQRLAVGGGHRP